MQNPLFTTASHYCLEHPVAPGWQIERKPGCADIEAGSSHHFREADRGKQQAQQALAPMIRIIDADEQALAVARLPRPDEEVLGGPVPFPRRRAFEKRPVAIAHGRPPQDLQEPRVELLPRSVRRLGRRPNEVRRDALAPPFELSLVEEAQPRREERDDRGGVVSGGLERRRGPLLVVVLQEAGELVLEIEAGGEMLANPARIAFPEPVVQPLVVRVVEALRKQCPFEIPVDLGEKKEAWEALADPRDGSRPERLRLPSPGLLEDLRQEQHGHVATDAVALPGNAEKLLGHRLLGGGIRVVELERVGPGGKVRIAAVRAEYSPAPGIFLVCSSQFELRPGDVVVRAALDPRMIERRVVRDEVEHEPQAARSQPLPDAGERGVAAEQGRDRIGGDRKPRAAYVFVAQIGQRVLEFAPPVAPGARDALAGGPGAPDAEEPDPVEALLGDEVQLRVAEIVESRRPRKPGRELAQPDPGIDLVERRISRRADVSARGLRLPSARPPDRALPARATRSCRNRGTAAP